MRNRRQWIKDLAYQRAILLYRQAVKAVKEGDIELARKYIQLGLRLLQKANMRKPYLYRRWVCKKCKVPLIPGVTVSVRVRRNRKQIIVVKKCLLCGWVNRTPCEKVRIKKSKPQ